MGFSHFTEEETKAPIQLLAQGYKARERAEFILVL